jgi:hypothetical protein
MNKSCCQQRIKIIGQLSLNLMVNVLLRGRQIFKFGLLNKKDNKKNLKIRLVSIRMVVAFFPPYYSYTNPLALMLTIITYKN